MSRGLLVVLTAVAGLLGGVVAIGAGGHAAYAYDAAFNNAPMRVVIEPEPTSTEHATTIRASTSGGTVSALAALVVAAEGEADAINSAGHAYTEVFNPGTGEPIPYPGEALTRVPVSERVTWGAQERGGFIKEWYDRGFSTPEGGWSNYDIHHIIPREYGGTNVFENLVPVERGVHQSEFNAWWRNY